MATSWRDQEGFGRPQQEGSNTFFVIGPDNESHALGCMFSQYEGVLPCSCDATRREFSWWWKCWIRWQKARVSRHHSVAPKDRVPWPVMGPDRDPWIPGIDFSDEEGE